MNLLDRIPFLPKHQGKRELVFVLVLIFGVIALGLIGAQTGWLYKDVPHSNATPTPITAPSASPPAGLLPPIVITA